MKIYVYGFPHCGTTILRKIIGDHSQITEYFDEIPLPPESKGNIVFKHPSLPSIEHKDCKRIMIMKNPYDVFGSFYRRFGDKYLTTKFHTLDSYCFMLQHFKTTKDYTVKYEDLFKMAQDGTFYEIKRIFEEYLAITYEGIKTRKTQIGYKWDHIPETEPSNQSEGTFHAHYRNWQINQPFQNMTGRSAKFLPDEGRELIWQRKEIREIYNEYYYNLR